MAIELDRASSKQTLELKLRSCNRMPLRRVVCINGHQQSNHRGVGESPKAQGRFANRAHGSCSTIEILQEALETARLKIVSYESNAQHLRDELTLEQTEGTATTLQLELLLLR